jgi:dimethylglycine dehydrogenase
MLGGDIPEAEDVKSHAQVAVIGGGVVGASVLYHLTKLGCNDVVLIERAELTAGSTWHAAGGMHTINSDPNVAKLQHYTINLYKELEELTGQSCGVHLTGGIMLADSQDRLDYLRATAARGRYLGMDTEFITPREAAERLPILDPSQYVGAMWDPNEGHVDPSGVTNAYARGARMAGAEIYRHNRVLELAAVTDGWQVVTEQGTVHAEHVVNAAGLWAREVGEMAGARLPFLPIEHQYLVTEPVPELAHLSNGFHAVDAGGGIYMRSEMQGVLLGTYEQGCKAWSATRTPWDFPQELLPSDLDRISHNLSRAFERFPPLAEVGIKNVINGPFTFTPDGNPLVGPVRGLRNYWAACGVIAGFSQGGGVGLALSNWIVNGDPGIDTWAMDVARFGDYAGKRYAFAKGRETYSTRFMIAFPNEERPAGRPLRRTPVYERLRARGAVFGAAFGLEQALWFAPEGVAAEETPTYGRSNAFEPVDQECRAVRERVGLVEISGFAKYEVSGAGAEMWLNALLANHTPRDGRMLLSPMLNQRGKLIGDFTVARLGSDAFMVFGSGIAEEYHMRWFEEHLPESGVTLRSLRSDLVGFSIAGPCAREVLSRLTDSDVSNEAFRFMSIRRMEVGSSPCLVARISFTGDLGYEIWCSPDYQLTLYENLLDAGGDKDIRHFGSRALNALRLEKSFGSFRREYTPDYSPREAGLDAFVDTRKNDFIGREAVIASAQEDPSLARVTLVVDALDADASGNEPIFHRDEVVGWVTSGGYAHYVGKSVALGYVPFALAGEQDFQIEILGQMRAARRAAQPLFDPAGTRMRS